MARPLLRTFVPETKMQTFERSTCGNDDTHELHMNYIMSPNFYYTVPGIFCSTPLKKTPDLSHFRPIFHRFWIQVSSSKHGHRAQNRRPTLVATRRCQRMAVRPWTRDVTGCRGFTGLKNSKSSASKSYIGNLGILFSSIFQHELLHSFIYSFTWNFMWFSLVCAPKCALAGWCSIRGRRKRSISSKVSMRWEKWWQRRRCWRCLPFLTFWTECSAGPYGGFHIVMGVPQNRSFMRENPIKIDDWRVPPLMEAPISGCLNHKPEAAYPTCRVAVSPSGMVESPAEHQTWRALWATGRCWCSSHAGAIENVETWAAWGDGAMARWPGGQVAWRMTQALQSLLIGCSWMVLQVESSAKPTSPDVGLPDPLWPRSKQSLAQRSCRFLFCWALGLGSEPCVFGKVREFRVFWCSCLLYPIVGALKIYENNQI